MLSGLLPVAAFLLALIFIDSYKLVRLRMLIIAIAAGSAAAGLSYVLNTELIKLFGRDFSAYSRHGSPFVEEILKAVVLIYFFKSQRIGFIVDGAILGFAAGAGFALVENIYFLSSSPEAPLLVWLIRGFGTAVMHGGTTATLAAITKGLADKFSKDPVVVCLPGLCGAFAVHSAFNHFFLPPLTMTAVIIIVLPLIAVPVFIASEKITRRWLDAGFDSDVALLGLITAGRVTTGPAGRYFLSLKSRFPGEVVADMLCLLRIHLELSISAKGILLMREEGFPVKVESCVKEKFAELAYLEKSIGPTGMRTIAPILHRSSRDLWELHLLGMG
jgi:RsiW-degrading membrane proteinase PrsW (M82 family)